MILVVADTSPLRYLVVIGVVDILPRVFDQIVVPEYVIKIELQDPQTPPEVRDWVCALPAWIQVREPVRVEDLGLHRGETDAIALAVELKALQSCWTMPMRGLWPLAKD